MKKITKILVVVTIIIIVFATTIVPAFALPYSESNTGIEFSIPSGWHKEELSEERVSIKAKYVHDDENGEIILFGYTDLWNNLSASDKVGYTKYDFNNSMFTKSDMAAIFDGNTANVTTVTYNNIEYFEQVVPMSVTSNGQIYSYNRHHLIYVFDGIMYSFSYNDPVIGNNHYSDFETLLNSVKYQTPKQVNILNVGKINNNTYFGIGPNGFVFGDFIFTLFFPLIITIAVYSLPIMIYRYAIKKKPIDEKKAKKIVIIYGIAAFIVMCFLLITLDNKGPKGVAILFWSYINYQILKN